MTFFTKNGHSFRFERDVIDVTPMSIPDFSWKYTDKQGHEHRWSTADGHLAKGIYQVAERYLVVTVHTVVGEPYYCMDCRDEHSDAWMECNWCHERIEPGYTSNHDRMFIAGLAHYYIDDEPVSKDEYDRRLAEEI